MSEAVFWVPAEARWPYLQAKAKRPEIGVIIDAAMDAIEHDNPSLKGVLPKTYARADVDKRLLGELVDLIGSIGFTDVDHGSDDVLGRVYEYFLGQFAKAEGQKAGAFYTPRSVVRLLVEMLEPFKGRAYDPCCGSGGMFVQSAEFVAAHGGTAGAIDAPVGIAGRSIPGIPGSLRAHTRSSEISAAEGRHPAQLARRGAAPAPLEPPG